MTAAVALLVAVVAMLVIDRYLLRCELDRALARLDVAERRASMSPLAATLKSHERGWRR